MNERELEALAQRLGEPAAVVDPDVTAERVVARLRAAKRPVDWWRSVGVLRAAAAAVVIVAAGFLVQQRVGIGTRGAAELPTPPVLQELASTQLAEVLDSLQVEAPVFEIVPAALNDLDDQELERLLQTLEG